MVNHRKSILLNYSSFVKNGEKFSMEWYIYQFCILKHPYIRLNNFRYNYPISLDARTISNYTNLGFNFVPLVFGMLHINYKFTLLNFYEWDPNILLYYTMFAKLRICSWWLWILINLSMNTTIFKLSWTIIYYLAPELYFLIVMLQKS